MRLPKGIILVSMILSVGILVIGASAGAAGASPSEGNSPGWQIGAQQGAAGGGQAPPGNGGALPYGQRGNGTAPMQGAPGLFDHGNMTPIDNRTPRELDNLTLPLNSTHRMHGNMTLDNRTPPDINATLPLDNPPAGNSDQPESGADTGQGTGAKTAQKSQIDELIEALSRFFNRSS